MTVGKTPWDPVSRPTLGGDTAGTASPEPPASATPVTATHGTGGVTAAVASSCGRLHDINEDWHSPPAADSMLYVVADGVGGGAMASTASRQLVAFLHAALDNRSVDASLLRQTLRDADRHIAGLIAAQTAAAGAATVALCCRTGASADRWLLGWVGDCRAYRLAAGASEAELLSADDTYARLGEAPPPGGSTDDPARMVGNGAVGDANTRNVELPPGALLLLCSDGVHKHVEATQMAALMAGAGTLTERCQRVVDLARANGSHDDATALVVQRPNTAKRPLGRWMLGGLLAALALGGGLHWLGGRSPATAPAAASAPAGSLPSDPATAASGNSGTPASGAARRAIPPAGAAASTLAPAPIVPAITGSPTEGPSSTAGGSLRGAGAARSGAPARPGKSAEPPGSPWAAETTAPAKRAAPASSPARRAAGADSTASTGPVRSDGATAAPAPASKSSTARAAASEPTAFDRSPARRNQP